METLERAATWSDEEKLTQLAGHHRGKGLQECNLVPDFYFTQILTVNMYRW